MYLSLARKYRPKNFDEVIGQEHIVTTLKNAIKLNKINPAYLFFGPRGTGKTSMARILAKSLNCKEGPSPICCCKCSSCLEIDESSSLDVIEIDGASNRGIDQIRELRESVGYSPLGGRFKLYIIDEVHMLTIEAFNALLKTLEEPPSNVIFVFATTDVQKVPETIASRTQMFEFRKLEKEKIEKALSSIVEKENFKLGKEAVSFIASLSGGSLRDGEAILDQVVLYKENASCDDIRRLFGICKEDVIISLLEMIRKKDINAIQYVKSLTEEGISCSMIVRGLLDALRNLIVEAGKNKEDIEWLIKAAESFCEMQERARRLPDDEELLLEVSIMKLIQSQEDISLEIKERWKEVLEVIGKKKPPLKSSLLEVESLEVDRDRLILSFNHRANTHRKIVEKEENKTIIEDVLEALFKRKLTLMIKDVPKRDIVSAGFEIFDAIEVK